MFTGLSGNFKRPNSLFQVEKKRLRGGQIIQETEVFVPDMEIIEMAGCRDR